MTEKTDNPPQSPAVEAAQPRAAAAPSAERAPAASPTFALPKTFVAQRAATVLRPVTAPAPDGAPASIYPADEEDIFAPRTSNAPEDDPRQYIEDRSRPPTHRGRGRPRKQASPGAEGDPGTDDAPPARSASTATAPHRQTATEKAKFDEARRKATIELRPIMDQLLNQPIPSLRAPGRTIDKKTVLTQDKVAIGLMRRFSAENSVAMGIDEFPYVKFADWLLGYSFRVAPTTFKKYRDYVVDYLTGLPGEDVTKAIDIIIHWASAEDEEDGDGENGFGGEDYFRGESSARRPQIIKHFPINDLVKILSHLRNKSYSQHGADLANLLEASIMTGLRPLEWKAATFIAQPEPTAPHGRRVWLFVANAKATNGRGNGVIRSIDLSEYSDAGLKPVIATVALAREHQAHGRFELEFRERFIKMMYRTTKFLWGSDPQKSYSLYSCRHQASANWKSVMSAVEVAALSGHAVPKTTQRWYGQKRTAWSPKILQKTARPHPEEVQKIAARMAMVKRHQLMTNGHGEDLDNLDTVLQQLKA